MYFDCITTVEAQYHQTGFWTLMYFVFVQISDVLHVYSDYDFALSRSSTI